MASIAIIGVGAIGGVAAALLETTSQHQLTLCTRRPLSKLIVKTGEGIITVKAANMIDPASAEAPAAKPASAETPAAKRAAAEAPAAKPASADPADWVLVATKVYDAKTAATWFPRLRGPHTPVAIIQNGVEHIANFSPFLRPEQIVPVIIDVPAERQPDNTIIQRGPVRMQVQNNPLGAEFAELFHGSKVTVTLEDDFLSAAWKKLCLNAAGAVCALLAKPSGVLRNEGLGQIVLDIISECMAVGRAEGARLDDGLGARILERFRSAPPDSVNSITADRLAGRPMEIDARNGVIVRKGLTHGIKTPVNKMIVALLNGVVARV
jgi:2-dehydropantoate 2-reductase